MLRSLLFESLLLESQFGTLEKLLKPETPPAFKNALKIAIEKVLSMNPDIVKKFGLNTNIADDFFTLDLPSDYVLYNINKGTDRIEYLTPEQIKEKIKIRQTFSIQQLKMMDDTFKILRVFNQIVKSTVGNDNADTFIKILNLPQVKGDDIELNKLADLFKIINAKGAINQKFSKNLDTFINNMLQIHIKWFGVPYRNQETVKPNIPIGNRILNYFDLFTILVEYINNSPLLNNFAKFSKLQLRNINFIDYLSKDFQINLWDMFLKDMSNFEFYKDLNTEPIKKAKSTIEYFAGYHSDFIDYCVDNNHWIPMKFDVPGVKVFLLPTYESVVMACNIIPYETDYTVDKSAASYSDSVGLNPHFFVEGKNPKNKDKKLRSTTQWCVKAKTSWQGYTMRFWEKRFLLILDNNLKHDDPQGAILTGLINNGGYVTVSSDNFMDANDLNAYSDFKKRSYFKDLLEALKSLNNGNMSEVFSKDSKLNIDKINLFGDLEKEIYEANLLEVLGFEITADEKTKSDVRFNIFNNPLFDLTNLRNIAKEKDVFDQFFLNLTQVITEMLNQNTKINFVKTQNNLVSTIEFFSFFDLFNNPDVNDTLSDIVLDEYINNNLLTIRKLLFNKKNIEQLPEDKLIDSLILFQKEPISNFKFEINSEFLQAFNPRLIENKINEIKQLYIDRCISEFNSLTDESIFNIIKELFYKQAYENSNNEVGEFFKDPNNTKNFIDTFFKVIQPLIVNRINENFDSNKNLISEYLLSIDKKINDKINETLNSLYTVKKFKVSQEFKLLNTLISKKFLSDKSTRETTTIEGGNKGKEHIPLHLLFKNINNFPLTINRYEDFKKNTILPTLNYIKNMQFYLSDDFLKANFNQEELDIILRHFDLHERHLKFFKSIRNFNINDDLIKKIENEDKDKQHQVHFFMFLLNNFFRMNNEWQNELSNETVTPNDNFLNLIDKFDSIFTNINIYFNHIAEKYQKRINFNSSSIFEQNLIKTPEKFKKSFIKAYQVVIRLNNNDDLNRIVDFYTMDEILGNIFISKDNAENVRLLNKCIYTNFIAGNPSMINYLNYIYSDDLGDIQGNFENLIRTKLNEFQTANPTDIFSVTFISLLSLTLIFTIAFKTKVLNATVANVLYNAILQIEQYPISEFYQQMSTVFIAFYILQNIKVENGVLSFFQLIDQRYSPDVDGLLQTFKTELEKSGHVNKTTIKNENITYIRRNQKIIISEKDLRKLLLKLL